MKKKFVSLLLAAALVFSLGVPAFAEGAEALPAEPEAAAAEDGLGDQRPGNQFAEQQPGNIQRRQQGIPHHMAPEDARFAHALGAGDRDEGLNRHLIHAAHQDLRQRGGNGQRDGDNR